ncbi:hypothetical protein HY310_00640, partial [Candidatus Microgenomates bacterium]|nr:hypothetical protein [Candidatus Microgenomates bacterium]
MSAETLLQRTHAAFREAGAQVHSYERYEPVPFVSEPYVVFISSGVIAESQHKPNGKIATLYLDRTGDMAGGALTSREVDMPRALTEVALFALPKKQVRGTSWGAIVREHEQVRKTRIERRLISLTTG